MRMRSTTSLVLMSLLSWTARGALAQGPSRVGAEFQVNALTAGSQQAAKVARNDAGSFVVVWTTALAADQEDIRARRFNDAGLPQGGELHVNTHTAERQLQPAIALADSGAFVAVWQSQPPASLEADVFGSRFSASGVPLATEFQVNTYTSSYQGTASVDVAPSGDFVVVWLSANQIGTASVFGQRFQSDGVAIGTEFHVNIATENSSSDPHVAVEDGGDFTVVWRQSGLLAARRFSSTGVGGDEIVVGSGDSPSLAADAAGNFVVAWEGGDGSFGGVVARRFNSIGDPLSAAFLVNTRTFYAQQSAAVAMDDSGDFVVTWHSFNTFDLSDVDVFAQHFAANGDRRGGEVLVNFHTANAQHVPDIAMKPDGDFVVVWSSTNQDGDQDGVFAQRFSTPKVLDVDGDGTFRSLTDGLLVLRYGFGFRGAVLTTGAVGLGCTRCNAAEIEPFIAGLV